MPDVIARTERGFAIYAKLVDSYASQISVVQSSYASAQRVWIFAKDSNHEDTFPHLSPEQAITVAGALHAWLRDIGYEPLGEYRRLERSLAYEHASSAIETNCKPVEDGGDWFDTSDVNPHAGDALADALLYLDLRGLLERDAQNLNWVSVRAESEED